MSDNGTTRLARARAIMDQVEEMAVTPESVDSIVARSAKAHALATIELAAATRAAALVAFVGTPQLVDTLTVHEFNAVVKTARVLVVGRREGER